MRAKSLWFLLATSVLLDLSQAAPPSIKLERGADSTWFLRIIGSETGPISVAVDANQSDLPSLLGSITSEGNDKIFRPRFPFQPGLSYRATLATNPSTVLKFSIPAVAKTQTRVTAIYPSADLLPENLLKFYVHFSQPMARGDAYRWITLLDERGRKIDAPFLELGEELWNADNTRLTLYFDPGRVKSDLLPGREMGAPLRDGHNYTLRIDAAWTDANGGALQAPHQKRFSVVAADHAPPEPKYWRVQAPSAESREPLTVEFPESLDHALLFRLLAVLGSDGRAIDGEIAVDRNETRWRFTPAASWKSGTYSLRAQTALEDLAGNKLNRPFEFEGVRTPEQRIAAESIDVSFAIRQK